MCRWVCASGRPAVPPPLSSPSSVSAAPHWCCWGPERPSPASLWASYCSGGRTPTSPATPRTAGTAPPGTRTSPCRWGWAGRGTRPSYTWTSPSPWSPAWSASHRCLEEGAGESGERVPSSGRIWVLQLAFHYCAAEVLNRCKGSLSNPEVFCFICPCFEVSVSLDSLFQNRNLWTVFIGNTFIQILDFN